MSSSPVDASTMLEALQSIQFDDSASLYANSDVIANFEKMPLASGSEATYFLVADNTALQARKPDSSASSLSFEVTTENSHPFYLRLYTASDSPTRSSWLPKFVLPLGRVVKETNNLEPEETNYVLVVDVTENNGAIWLIYNRFPVNQDVGVRPDTPIDPSSQPQVFDIPNVHSIRIMDSIAVWVKRGGSTMRSTEIANLAKAFGGREAVLVTWAKTDDVFGMDSPNPAFGG